VILEGRYLKSPLEPSFLKNYLPICLHRKQLVLEAGSSINDVQSLLLEHDDLSNFHMELIVLLPWQQAMSQKWLFFKKRIKVFEFQFTQICSIM